MAERTQYIYLSGKTKWFRANQPNKYGKWSHDIYLNEESLAKFKELQMTQEDGTEGIRNDLKRDEDGTYVTISRPVQKMYFGKPSSMEPPLVLDKSGAPYRGNVGNGSDVTSKVEVYSYAVPMAKGKRGSAIRWNSSRIDNLVEYRPETDNFGVETTRTKALMNQPEPVQGGW